MRHRRFDKIERSLVRQVNSMANPCRLFKVRLMFQDPDGRLKLRKLGMYTATDSIPEVLSASIHHLDKKAESTLVRVEYIAPKDRICNPVEIYIET